MMNTEVMTPRTVLFVSVASALIAFLVAFYGPKILSREQPPQRFAYVDLTTVVSKKQEQSVRALADPNATDDTKKKALKEAQEFGARVDKALLELAGQCQCTLLMKEAVVSGQLEDMTQRLSALLGE